VTKVTNPSISPIGDFDQVAHLFTDAKPINLSNFQGVFDSDTLEETISDSPVKIRDFIVKKAGRDKSDRSPKYKVQTGLLFGEHKVGYMIPRKKNPKIKMRFGQNKDAEIKVEIK
jgi:hypothetical protein